MEFLKNFKILGKSSSGKGPSERMSREGKLYQVKRSKFISFARYIIGLDTDYADIAGELIASKIAKELEEDFYEDKPADVELHPEVEAVIDEESEELRIASRYLNSGNKNSDGTERFISGTLDDVARGIDGSEGSSHPIISAEEIDSDGTTQLLVLDQEYETELNGEKVIVKIDKKSLYEALKVSMLLGDHDINPGNLFLTFDKKQKNLIYQELILVMHYLT